MHRAVLDPVLGGPETSPIVDLTPPASTPQCSEDDRAESVPNCLVVLLREVRAQG
jgi:hypothetical protein